MDSAQFILTALAAAPEDPHVLVIPRPWDEAIDIRVSDLLDPGQFIVVDGVVFIHLREMIRLRHPAGIDGTIAASLEWQRAVIDRNAKIAVESLYATTAYLAAVDVRRHRLTFCPMSTRRHRWRQEGEEKMRALRSCSQCNEVATDEELVRLEVRL